MKEDLSPFDPEFWPEKMTRTEGDLEISVLRSAFPEIFAHWLFKRKGNKDRRLASLTGLVRHDRIADRMVQRVRKAGFITFSKGEWHPTEKLNKITNR